MRANPASGCKAIESLIPAALRPAVRPGPIDGTTWCLLVDNNAAAAKLRQVLPALQASLRDRGWQVTSIRLKVQTGAKVTDKREPHVAVEMVPIVGIELTTYRLQGGCSTN